MARAMVALSCASFRQVPRRITLDIDDTFDTVHGAQQLRLFNAYYDEYGFQPIVVFDPEGRPVATMLRPARRPTGAEARAFLRRLVCEIRSHWPRVEILIRADSHYCAPEVLQFCRAARIDFVLGVATTTTMLRRHVDALQARTASRSPARPRERSCGATRNSMIVPQAGRSRRSRAAGHRYALRRNLPRRGIGARDLRGPLLPARPGRESYQGVEAPSRRQ